MNKTVEMIGAWLLVIGGLNWGLVGLGMGNVVEMLLGAWPMLVSVIYILVGLSALWSAWSMIAKKGM